MKIIIPMAGIGKRMRPHTLTIPKPLIPIAGKPIVHRLVEEIGKNLNEKIEEIAFIIGDFGVEVENRLHEIAKSIGADSKIYYQEEALGTAHAIYCAKDSLKGKVIVAYADTLLKADFVMEEKSDGIIWVKKVDDPSSFGVVKIDENEIITDFIEKPKDKISDLAIIGIYYFKDGENFSKELKYLFDNDIVVNGEYQLTDALENMKNKNISFKTSEVEEWLDCGNKDATVYTNQRILELHKDEKLISDSANIQNSIIKAPCFIDENVIIKNSIIGPHLSIGANSQIVNSIVRNGIIQSNSKVEDLNIKNSMIGNSVEIVGDVPEMSIGDFTTIIH